MYTDVFFAAEIDLHISVIDLHASKNIHDALMQLEKELFSLSKSHAQYAKIVYGIGEGKLRSVVLHSLEQHPQIQAFKETNEGGSCLVIF